MAQITLVLPFALPAPEFAPDLTRTLQAPGLAGLLSRTARTAFVALDANARVLPHELFVARALGLAHGAVPCLATRAMQGFGLDPGDGTWYVVNPVHIQIGHSHLSMGDLRLLDLRDDEARALFDTARAACVDGGYDLLYGDADTWFLRADGWDGLVTSSPDAAVGMSLTDWLPSGPPSRAFRKLQNDVQVAWYTHPSNTAREARGQAPINAFWPWGGASLAHEHAGRLVRKAGSAPDTAGAPRLAACEVPGWLGALGERVPALSAMAGLAADAGAGAQPLLLVCGNAAAPAIGADWHAWLEQMSRLESELFAPLLEHVARGRVKELRLVLSHRDGHLDLTTTPLAQRKFWRRPTLDPLR